VLDLQDEREKSENTDEAGTRGGHRLGGRTSEHRNLTGRGGAANWGSGASPCGRYTDGRIVESRGRQWRLRGDRRHTGADWHGGHGNRRRDDFGRCVDGGNLHFRSGVNGRHTRLLRFRNEDGRGGTSSSSASGRKTASAVGLPGGAVHDGFGDDRLGHGARAIGDHQRGRLD
jgi:hypothetical protein